MVPVHFNPDDFATGWAALKRTQNLGGLVVSVPLKEQAFGLADEVEKAAQELGCSKRGSTYS